MNMQGTNALSIEAIETRKKKRFLIDNLILSCCVLFSVGILFIIKKVFIADFPTVNLIVQLVLTIVVLIISFLIIIINKKVTDSSVRIFVHYIFISTLALLLYSASYIGEYRGMLLFIALLGFFGGYPYVWSNKLFIIYGSLFSVCYSAITVYSITVMSQPGNLARELLFVVIFLLVVIVFSYVSYRSFLQQEIIREANKKIKEQAEQLKELDRVKSDFFANISHEIRTPLTLILAPVESYLQGEYTAPVDASFFQTIYRNGIRLLDLINNLLDFSKIEAGRMTMRVQETDMSGFLSDFANDVRTSAESRGVAFTFTGPLTAIFAYIDREKIDRVCMNLFSNALKFTDSGGFIDITLRDEEGSCVILFRDSGCGIPEEKLEDIFDRFSQVDSSSTRMHEGTGIGLAIAKEFAALHGGHISVQSTIGDNHGSTFFLSIPRGKKHFKGRTTVTIVDDTNIIDTARRRRALESIPRNDERPHDSVNRFDDITAPLRRSVLIVEDNGDMRNLLMALLEREYRVFSAEDGVDGFEKACEFLPDVVISDVMMPRMNGYELIRRIKAEQRLAGTPVILLTAKADVIDKIEGIEQGADDYVTKPFNSKELLARVNGIINSRENERALSARNYEIETELETARLIQQKLLPDEHLVLPGYRSHALYIPMDKVGGDFYDIRKNGNSIQLFMADVSGHGLASSFLALITKMALDNVGAGAGPSDILKSINDVIVRTTVRNNFVTAFIAEFDMRDNVLRYANAGHVPPLLYRPNQNSFFELKTRGTPLGWFSKLIIDEGNLHLERGDRLALYTDGIIECRNHAGDFFGDDRFKELIRSGMALDPKAFTDVVVTAVKTYSETDSFDDDLTLLVMDIV